MKTEIKKIAALISILATTTFAALPSVIGVNTATATVTVSTSCSLDATPTSISFGELQAGHTSDPKQTVTLNNNAAESNVPASVELYGTAWGTGFPESATHYAFGGGTPPFTQELGTLVTPSPGGSVLVNTPVDVDFTVSVPNNQPAGGYSQVITFSFTCPQ